jgi:hypothetical protein
MRNAVKRQVEWAAPPIEIQTEVWVEEGSPTRRSLTHRLLMGDRKGFGQLRWSRNIQGAYRSIRPVLPSLADSAPVYDLTIMQLQLLQDQLHTLDSYTMDTDGGWEYGGDDIDAPFYPYMVCPIHKGGGSIIITTHLVRIQNNIFFGKNRLNLAKRAKSRTSTQQ